MSGRIEKRLAELGVELPPPGPTAGNYVAAVISDGLAHLSGQIPIENGERKFIGKLGKEFSVEDGHKAARLCAVNLLARLKTVCDGDLDHVRRCVKLGGFVNCTPEFGDMPLVINGASDFMVEVFGEAGRHARFAVGVASLPFGVAVELDGIFEIG